MGAPRFSARAAVGLLGIGATTLVGCATASPFLAPARVLRSNKLELDVGTAYSAPVVETALTRARSAPATDEDRLRAAAAYGVTPPGVVPYVAGRTGFGTRNEGAVALIGRTVRIGARREFVRSGDFSLTAGINARLAFLSGNQGGVIPRVAVVEGQVYGGELTLQIGTQRQDIYHVWGGVRAGYLYGDSRLALEGAGTSAQEYAFGSHRVELSANVGLRVGFGRIAVAAELDVGYLWATATGTRIGGTAGAQETGSANGLTLTPAGAVTYRF